MRLVIGFAHGGERSFRIDSFKFDDVEGFIELFKDGITSGIISLNNIAYWFTEE